MPVAPPFVSILVYVRDHAPTVSRALDSARSQTYPDDGYEIVAIDDGSTDGAAPLLEALAEETPYRRRHGEPTIVVVTLPGVGLATALNAGIGKARGRFVLRLGAEDTLHPEALTRLVDAIGAAPEAVAAVGDHIVMVAEGKAGVEHRVDPSRIEDAIDGGLLLPTEMLRDVGGYRAVPHPHRDLLERLGVRHRIAHAGMAVYRRGPGVTPRSAHDDADSLGGQVVLTKSSSKSAMGWGRARALDERGTRALFAGRRVCVVGSAGSLERLVDENEHGARIDEHDLIVRLNQAVVDDETARYTGRRTDVFVLNNRLSSVTAGWEIDQWMRRLDCQILLSKQKGTRLYRTLRVQPLGRHLFVGNLPEDPVFDALGEQVLTLGTLTVASLLAQTELASLYVTGFDFYTTRSAYYYHSDYRVIDPNHDSRREVRYWRDVLRADPRLEVDSVIDRILTRAPDDRADETDSLAQVDLPLRAGSRSVRTLDLRCSDHAVLEVKCLAGSDWQVAFGARRPHTHVLLEISSELVYLVLPNEATYSIENSISESSILSRHAMQSEGAVSNHDLETCHFDIRIEGVPCVLGILPANPLVGTSPRSIPLRN